MTNLAHREDRERIAGALKIAPLEVLETKDIRDIGEGVGIVVLVEVVEIAVEADIVETMGFLAVLGMRKNRVVDIAGMTKVLGKLAMMGLLECPSHWREMFTKISTATEVVVPAGREGGCGRFALDALSTEAAEMLAEVLMCVRRMESG
jgi:hypothetical protein